MAYFLVLTLRSDWMTDEKEKEEVITEMDRGIVQIIIFRDMCPAKLPTIDSDF